MYCKSPTNAIIVLSLGRLLYYCIVELLFWQYNNNIIVRTPEFNWWQAIFCFCSASVNLRNSIFSRLMKTRIVQQCGKVTRKYAYLEVVIFIRPVQDYGSYDSPKSLISNPMVNLDMLNISNSCCICNENQWRYCNTTTWNTY